MLKVPVEAGGQLWYNKSMEMRKRMSWSAGIAGIILVFLPLTSRAESLEKMLERYVKGPDERAALEKAIGEEVADRFYEIKAGNIQTPHVLMANVDSVADEEAIVGFSFTPDQGWVIVLKKKSGTWGILGQVQTGYVEWLGAEDLFHSRKLALVVKAAHVSPDSENHYREVYLWRGKDFKRAFLGNERRIERNPKSGRPGIEEEATITYAEEKKTGPKDIVRQGILRQYELDTQAQTYGEKPFLEETFKEVYRWENASARFRLVKP
jgi:hypothetical protein